MQPLNLAASYTAVCEVREGPRFSKEQASFIQWLFSRAGLDPGAYREETLVRRLPACLRLLRAPSLAHARRLLEENPALTAPSMSVMLVGVTAFFRDPDVFDWLGREAWPAARDGARNGLYAWSVGCSDGAELHSLAMLFAEKGNLADSYLLGTDCRPEAIERARAGLYDAEAVKGVPGDMLHRYFTPEEGRWRVVPQVRTTIRWAVSDLLKSIEPGAWDLILF